MKEKESLLDADRSDTFDSLLDRYCNETQHLNPT